MMEVLNEIRDYLTQSADETLRISGQRYFKEEVKIYGIKTADVIKFAKSIITKNPWLTKKDIFHLAESLFQSGIMEESFIACELVYSQARQFTPEDFVFFENQVKNYINNWASCDTLCNHTIGDFIMKYPDFISKLKLWAQSENRWVKRAAAVTLIIPARKGLFKEDIFEIADLLLMDRDDLVQKGYGWMLKACSQFYQNDVFEYVIKHKDNMPRTALRYAIEKMPKDLKEKAMERQKH